ncbi:MAG: phage head closure protein [Acinetobacter sp.]|nr:phage head closure protein [Acinetobacter sp.]
MQTGSLTDYVEVQKRGVVQASDGSGDRVTDYVTEFAVWADIQGVNVSEFIAARANQFKLSHRIVVRFNDVPHGIQWKDYRLLCEGEIYKILGALPDNRSGKEWITLTCESGSAVWPEQP